MKDALGRTIDYIRLSITDRCNLRCRYCMPEEGIEDRRVGHDALLRYEELLRLAKVLVSLGITRYKITGGEPLVRLGAVPFIADLKKIPGVASVTLTTNGVLLPVYAKELIEAGIDGINVSLDTLDSARFSHITRRNEGQQVLAGIEELMEMNYPNLKINTVPIAGFNEADIVPLAGLAKRWPLHVRFIEMMPIGEGSSWQGIAPDQVRALLEEAYGVGVPYGGRLGNGPAEYLSFPDFKGKIGFISAVHNKFCDSCNRVRLTSTGFLKLCLQYDQGLDVRPYLEKDDEALRKAIQGAIMQKPRGHCFGSNAPIASGETRGMSDIGG